MAGATRPWHGSAFGCSDPLVPAPARSLRIEAAARPGPRPLQPDLKPRLRLDPDGERRARDSEASRSAERELRPAMLFCSDSEMSSGMGRCGADTEPVLAEKIEKKNLLSGVGWSATLVPCFERGFERGCFKRDSVGDGAAWIGLLGLLHPVAPTYTMPGVSCQQSPLPVGPIWVG